MTIDDYMDQLVVLDGQLGTRWYHYERLRREKSRTRHNGWFILVHLMTLVTEPRFTLFVEASNNYTDLTLDQVQEIQKTAQVKIILVENHTGELL